MTVEEVSALRAEIWDAGYRPVPVLNPGVPCTSPGKQPAGLAWQMQARETPPLACRQTDADALNTGLLCDGLRALDIDIEDASVVARVRAMAVFAFGETIIRTRDNSARCLLVYRAAEGEPRKRKIEGALGKVEMLGRGNQFVAYGRHSSGAVLNWINGSPRDMARDHLPAVTEDQITAFFRDIAPVIGATGKEARSSETLDTPADVRAMIGDMMDAGAGDIDSTSDLPDRLRERLDAALRRQPRLLARWIGDHADLLAAGRDHSRSGRDMSLAAMLKGCGFGDIEAAFLLLAYEHGCASDSELYPTVWHRVRYVARTVLRSSVANMSEVRPDPRPGFLPPGGAAEGQGSDAHGAASASAPRPTPLWVDRGMWQAAEVPKRPWVVPSYLMRGSVSILSGQGAGGKSSLVVAWTLALAAGEELGMFRPLSPCTVVNYNVEDDRDEQHRRYGAALAAQKRDGAAVMPSIVRCGPYDVGTLFERDAQGRIAQTAAMDALERLCMETACDVLVCDPLAELHNAEENDNTAMRAVVAAFRSLARRLDIAVLVLHHDRKGSNAPGEMDRMRGASAISGAVRVMLTLTTMSAEEADKCGVAPDERRRHFRIDGAKSNYAPPAEAEWWRLHAYPVGNGEDVAACLPREPPSAFGGMTMERCVAVLARLRTGTPRGHRFGATKQAGEEWAGRLLMDDPLNVMGDPPKKTEGQAVAILATWEAEGVLETDNHPSPRRGHNRKAYTVVEAKFQEMKQQLVGEIDLG